MGTGSVLLKSLAMTATAGFMLMACSDDGKNGTTGGPTNRSSADLSDTLDATSQGTGYSGLGMGTGGAGAPDHTGVSEEDMDFERSFYGPPASDWRFTPGTGLHNFLDKGIGGTGGDSQTKANPVKTPTSSLQDKAKAHDLSDSSKNGMQKRDSDAGSH